MGIGGLILSFVISWMFTLIAFAYMPIVFLGFAIFGVRVKQNTILKMQAVRDLGSYTEETLSALKLVIAFNREEYAVKEFDKIANETKKKAMLSATSMAAMMGFMMATMFGFFCYGYYIGSILIQKDMTEPGTGKKFDINLVVTACQATLMGMMTLSQFIPILPGITRALMSAQQVFDVIEREPAIKNPETGAIQVASLKNGVSF